MESSKNDSKVSVSDSASSSTTSTASLNDEAMSFQYKEKNNNEQRTAEFKSELFTRYSHENNENDIHSISHMHKFWDTQPVPKMNQTFSSEDSGPLDAPCFVDDIRKEPYKLPEGFFWCDCAIFNDEELDEVYNLLYGHYVEDDDCMFRFDYSREFLRWCLSPPDFCPDWHCGVRVKSNNKLVAFITGVPARVHVNGKDLDVAEINFLCVHKKLRTKRLAPVLIKEITRRVNLRNKWQAVYTAGTILPKPVAKCRYWHRSLNPKKLVEVGFSSLGARMTMSRTIKLYRVNENVQLQGIRKMEEKDVADVCILVKEYLKKYKLYPILTKEECAHWFLPRDKIIYSYVRINEEGKLVDFFSFYSLPSTVIRKEKHSAVYAAYSYYNVATSVDFKQLMSDALTLAKKEGFDVYNALDVMDNDTFLKELKFGVGDGYLRYYLYNWKCPELQHSDVGLVLL